MNNIVSQLLLIPKVEYYKLKLCMLYVSVVPIFLTVTNIFEFHIGSETVKEERLGNCTSYNVFYLKVSI